MLMHSTIVSVSVNVTVQVAYAYVREPDNFCKWASGICQSVTVRDGVWFVDTGTELGTVMLNFCADNVFGVLDHKVTLPDGKAVMNPMRAVANGDGCQVYFIVFQPPEMGDEQYAQDVQAVRRDLNALKELLEA